jgi:hypothetical protein
MEREREREKERDVEHGFFIFKRNDWHLLIILLQNIRCWFLRKVVSISLRKIGVNLHHKVLSQLDVCGSIFHDLHSLLSNLGLFRILEQSFNVF